MFIVDLNSNTRGHGVKKLDFFIGNAGKSRGHSPRYLSHDVMKSPDDSLTDFENGLTNESDYQNNKEQSL